MSVQASATRSSEHRHDVAQRELARAQTKLFIDGDFHHVVDGGRFASISPASLDASF